MARQELPQIALKRAYAAAEEGDGVRILVERLWPRGVAREKAKFDHWYKSLAPSAGLRTWYGHVPDRWPEFQSRYRAELDAPDTRDELENLIELCCSQPVTFVYAARDEERNSALVLRARVLELSQQRG